MSSIERIYKLFLQSPAISTDSRQIAKNSLFFALKGDNFNGNKYAVDALNKGAAFAIIDDSQFAISDKTILVDNVLYTLQKLARYHRDKLKLPILAITGTNGKTTTKELSALVLSKKFNVSFTLGNLNNHIGVPLTLLQMNAKTEFGVVEMGANHPGEIAELCEIANPDFGIITNIGKAHLEGFGSFEGVKKTKAELYEYIHKKEGTVFINTDNQILCELGIKNKVQMITYGQFNAGFQGEPISSPPFVHVKANFKKGILFLNSNLIGDFNFENILAAACIGNYFKVDPLKIQQAIKEYQPQNIRSQLIKKGNINLIMDAYNANPTSLLASINSFLKSFPTNNYLIIGDMLELGKYSKEEHKKILEFLSGTKVKSIFLVGSNFSEINKDYNFKSFATVFDLQDFLKINTIKNGNILVKGSRGIQLEKILEIF